VDEEDNAVGPLSHQLRVLYRARLGPLAALTIGEFLTPVQLAGWLPVLSSAGIVQLRPRRLISGPTPPAEVLSGAAPARPGRATGVRYAGAGGEGCLYAAADPLDQLRGEALGPARRGLAGSPADDLRGWPSPCPPTTAPTARGHAAVGMLASTISEVGGALAYAPSSDAVAPPRSPQPLPRWPSCAGRRCPCSRWRWPRSPPVVPRPSW
jgi:hypothetical protein